MNNEFLRWKKLFLFGLGLTVAAAFCMKWMENDLWIGNEKFTVVGLEFFYPKEKVTAILWVLDSHVKTILRYHLTFDFAFMVGVYPAIAALCMMARAKRTSILLRRVLFIFAFLQLVAWACDISENYFLLKWINQPEIGNEFLFYHLVVFVKWTLALIGIFISVPVFLVRKKR